MSDHTFFEHHLDTIVMAGATVSAVILGWILRIERRLGKSDTNDIRITALEHKDTKDERRFDAALTKAENDHDKIKDEVSSIRAEVHETRQDVSAVRATQTIHGDQINKIFELLRDRQ